MNKARRKRLSEAVEMLDTLQSLIEEVKDEEQEAYDNLPEGLQMSEKGELMESYIEKLEEAFDYIGDVSMSLSEIIEE